MKQLALLTVLLGLSHMVVKAQKKQYIYFLKDDGTSVSVKDSADFIRVIREPDSGVVNFTLLEFYPDNKKKTLGAVSSFNPRTMVYEGALLKFDKAGKKISLSNYENNKLIGSAYEFYPNGSLKQTIEYPEKPTEAPMKGKFRYFADTLGNVLVNEGSGRYLNRVIGSNTEETIEEGDYRDGLKDGEWTVKNITNNYWYKEQFKAGEFISGQSFFDGVTYDYKVMEELPSFKDGFEAFYKYLARNLKHPTGVATPRINGKVFLSFVIERDGSITDVKVERKLYPSLDMEAIRVLRSSPKWIPARQHGIPVRVKYNIPIAFST